MAKYKSVPIKDAEIAGCIKPLSTAGPFLTPEGTCYRDIEADIQKYNSLSLLTTVMDLLHESELFLHRQFGRLTIREIYLRRETGQPPQLMAKSRCSCGNTVISPLHLLIDGSLVDCGCSTPLPDGAENQIIVYQSEAPTRWTTTVDGIQWFGNRYVWFVSLTIGQECLLQKYADSAKEALDLRRDAERKYFGKSIIDQYYDLMLAELEDLERHYVRQHPPKVQGVSWNKADKRWIARLEYEHKWILNKSFKDRKSAVKARLEAEKKYFGKSLMPERYYV